MAIFPKLSISNPMMPVFAELSGVVVDQHGHHVPVDDMSHGVAAGDDVQLIPVVDLYVTAQLVLIAQRRRQTRSLPSSVCTTWPRQAMMPRPVACS